MRRRSTTLAVRTSQITFNKSISDPSNITGDINQGVIAEILTKVRRCLAKKSADGEITIAYLKNDDSNYYADGTAANLTGTEGDVMVYMPEFYYKYEKVDDNKFRYHLALQKIDDTYIQVSESLLGAYQAINVSNKLYSRSGVVPTLSISQANLKVYASARGKGYGIINYEQHCAIALLFFCKYGNRNSQAILGAGNKNFTHASGSTNSLGNRDTVKTTTTHASFLGIEAVHGAMYEWVDGLVIDNYVWKITNPVTGAVRQVTTPLRTNGEWIKEIAAAAGPYFDIIPTEGGGNETTYYSNQYNCSSGGSYVLARSFWGSGSGGGITFAAADSYSTYKGSYSGSRLAFRGVIREALSISDFKALSINN